MIYEKFISELFHGLKSMVLALHCYSRDKKNSDFFQMTCFKEDRNMAVEKNLRVTINFYKKCLPFINGLRNSHQRKLCH